MDFAVLIRKILRNWHLARRKRQIKRFQATVDNGWKTVFVNNDMEVVTRCCFNLMDQNPNIVDSVQTLGLFKITTAFDHTEKLFGWHRLKEPFCF